MKYLLSFVIVSLLVGILAALDELWISVPLKGRKYRSLTMLIVGPTAGLFAVVATYLYTAWPVWASLVVTLILLVVGVAFAIMLVGRALPAKINPRDE